MKLFRDENGQTLVFTAFLACCLMGFMALAIDVGVLFRAQRKVQTAADAAAIAGGLEYYYNGSANAASVAKTAASNNGITDTNQVTVNIPPAGGWHTGSSYLEVIIQQPNSTIFAAAVSSILPGGGSYSTMNVSARAVSGITPGQACVYVLDPSNAGSLTVKGGASVTTPNCAIQVDSTSSQALCVTGNNANASFSSDGVYLVNPQQTQGNCNKLYPAAQSGSPSASNPFGSTLSFPDPTSTSICDSSNTITAGTVTAIPSGITAKTVSTGGFNSSSSTLSYSVYCFNAGVNTPTLISGTYGTSSNPNTLFLFENGMAVTGNTTFNGTVDLNNGVFCQGGLKSNGSCQFNSTLNNFNITAPANSSTSTYAWNGMAFVMPATNTAPGCDSSYGGPTVSPTGTPDSCLQMQFGSGSGNLTGLIYAPGTSMYMQDNGGGTVVAGLIVDSLYVNSSLTITNNYNYANPDSPLNHVSLVE